MFGTERLVFRLLGSTLSLLALSACERLPERPDLLVITLDTARADRFSYLGDSQVATPRVDALAAESTTFLDAVAPAPITLVSHASLFTGLLPPAHGVRNNGNYRLHESVTTLAELLRAKQYRTGAFIGSAVLDSRYGLDQGFERYDDNVHEGGFRTERSGEDVVRSATDWLASVASEPTFAWVHLFDPHDPYEPPEPERSSHPQSFYDAEIAYVDRVVGQLLDGYREAGRYRNLVVVLTADHGESLGEHGEETHGVFLYEATIRIPLIIRVPAVGVGRRAAAQVQLVDVLPTLAEVMGLEPPTAATGQSLLPALRGERLEARPAYSESLLPRENYGWAELRSVRLDGWKLVVGAEMELYDLTSDPGETRDLAGLERERAARLQRMLESEARRATEGVVERLEIDDRARRQLEALGYVSTAVPDLGTKEDSRELADPRQRIHLIRARSTAEMLFDRGLHQQAIERSEAILEIDTSNAWVRRRLSAMLLSVGRFDEAESHLSTLTRQAPATSAAWKLLAVLYERTGREELAISAYRSALEADPADPDARERSWDLLLASGQHDLVAEEALAALETDPQDHAARTFLAIARWRHVDPQRQLLELAEISREAGAEPESLSALGDAYHSHGDYRRALRVHARAQSLVPDSNRYAIRLARTLASLGRGKDVWHVLRYIRKSEELDPDAWLLLGAACRAMGDRTCAARAMSRASALVPGPLKPLLEGVFGESGTGPGAGPQQAELLLLAGRSEEAAALLGSAAGKASGGAPPQGRSLTGRVGSEATAAFGSWRTGGDEISREQLRQRYRALDLPAALAYAAACAEAGDDVAVEEALTLLTEVLVSGEGPTDLPRLSRDDRLSATAVLTQVGNRSWGRSEYWNAAHAYLMGAHLVPDDPRPQFNLGLAWERIGDFREAREAFRRALELDGEFPRAREHYAEMARRTELGSRAP